MYGIRTYLLLARSRKCRTFYIHDAARLCCPSGPSGPSGPSCDASLGLGGRGFPKRAVDLPISLTPSSKLSTNSHKPGVVRAGNLVISIWLLRIPIGM